MLDAFLLPIANLLGVSVTQLIVVTVLSVGLVIGWYALKVVLKLAVRAFAAGLFMILAAAVALYVYFAFFV